MSTDHSLAALTEFLDYLADKGLMNAATVSARKAAVNKVLGFLDASEVEDVTAVDLDSVMYRFQNRYRSEYSPPSLAAYKSRVRSAIEDFSKFQKDPASYRPARASVSRKNRERTKSADRETADRSLETPPIQLYDGPTDIIPIPIRNGLTVRISGVPYDLTRSEAAKIANVIRAMATSEDE